MDIRWWHQFFPLSYCNWVYAHITWCFYPIKSFFCIWCLSRFLCKSYSIRTFPPFLTNFSSYFVWHPLSLFDFCLHMLKSVYLVFARYHSWITGICTVLYCTALYCIVLYCTLLYSALPYCTVLYSAVLCCIVLYCTVQYSTLLYCTVQCCIVLYCTVLYCIVLYCTLLYSTVMYCTVLYWTVLYYTVLYTYFNNCALLSSLLMPR